MRGSKRQRKPGVWELRAYVGQKDGRDVQKSRTFRGCEAVFLGTYLHAAPAKDGPIAELLGAAIDEAMGQSRA